MSDLSPNENAANNSRSESTIADSLPLPNMDQETPKMDVESASPAPQENTTPPSFPEGGMRAWTVVAGSFSVLFCTFGYLNGYGVYQNYYQTHQLSSMTSSSISWIGSVQVFFLYAGGIIGGPLFDRFGGIVITPPAILFIFSVMMTSLSSQYYQFMLAQGILGGTCCGMMFTPAMAAIGQYFQARRGVAMGVAVTGSSLGGVIFPIALSKMIAEKRLEFAWSVRIVGFMMLALLCLSCATVRRRLPPRGGNVLVPSAFKNRSYLLAIVAFFFLVWGLFFPFFYVEEYALAQGMSANLASYVLSILNAASIFGRLLPGFVADRFGNFLTLSVSGIATAILVFCWMAIHSDAAIVVFCLFYGFFSGAIVTLMSPCFAQIAPRPNVIGAYLGMALSIVGLAGLTGTPIAGAIIQNHGWHSAMVFSGVSVLVGAVLAFVTKLSLNQTLFGRA